MKKINLLIITILLSLFYTSCKDTKSNDKKNETAKTEQSQRIVSLSGAVTEIISDLGKKDAIVGVDVTSTYPADLKAENLGHNRTLSTEPILALKPDLVLGSKKDTNKEVIQKLKDAGVNVVLFDQEFSSNGSKKLINEVANTLEIPEEAEKLNKSIDEKLSAIQQFKQKPKVLFIYARGTNTMMVAGKNTPMEAMVELAGGEYAVKDFEGFKPLNAEALIEANPDVILLFDTGLQSLGGKTELLNINGVSQTNAGKQEAIISMDGGLMSSFGSRVAEAANQLNELIAPYAK